MNHTNFLGPAISTVLGLWAAGAAASDLPRISAPNHAPPPPPPFSWTGLYIGGHMGGAFDGSNFSNPFGPTLFGDNVRSPGGIGGLQIGYNWQYGATVLGVEADVTAADLDGTFTCLQPVRSLGDVQLGGAFGATCRVRPDWFGTLTARIGTTFGADGRTLVYAKGGLAWIHDNIDIATNNALAGLLGPPNATSSAGFTQWGWTVGAGVEYALVGNWSARLEYDFLAFGGHDVPTPNAAPLLLIPSELVSVPDGRTASVSQGVHVAKLGVNYRFSDSPGPYPSEWPAIVPGASTRGPDALEVEIGARYVHGWDRFQKDLGKVTAPLPVNNSRLTWDDLGTDGAEMFWRVDGPYRLMTKGFWGGGDSHSGHVNDEDWGLLQQVGDNVAVVTPFQNTLGPAHSSINYVTADFGYNLLTGPGYKLSPFVGYSHFSQGMSDSSILIVSVTPPQGPFPGTFLQEFDSWNALRVGAVADLMLIPRLKLTADAAWLPVVHFEGLDVHPMRTEQPSIFSPEAGNGRGVQLETTLTYDVTEQFSVGVGGRYWAMWVPNGQVNIFQSGRLPPIRLAAEQAAVFLQASYKFGVPCCAGLFQ